MLDGLRPNRNLTGPFHDRIRPITLALINPVNCDSERYSRLQVTVCSGGDKGCRFDPLCLFIAGLLRPANDARIFGGFPGGFGSSCFGPGITGGKNTASVAAQEAGAVAW
jgi:hypothetical protein